VKAPTEATLVRACLELLALRRIFGWRNNSGGFVVGEGKDRRLVRAGLKGSPDIIAVLPPTGRFVGIECKVGRNRPTPEQAAFLETVRAAGGLALVVWDVRELAEALDGLQAGAT
jgi:hypothetical protein